MKSILVAVDGSPHSTRGLKEAVTLAKALNYKLELVYVMPPVLLAPGLYAEAIARVEEGNREVAAQLLDEARKAATAEGAPGVDTVVLNGAPAEAIADLAQADRIWGVVIGAKGHSAISRVLLGSVADRLVHISNKPVLVVR